MKDSKTTKWKTSLYYIVVLCTLLVFCSGSLQVNALWRDDSVPSFEVIDRASGLSNLSVSSMIQDRNGFLWFGTQGGLNRYDGRNMHVIRHNPFDDQGLVHNLIQTMYYDEQSHELWIGTYQGVSRLLIDENTFINYTVDQDGLTNPVVIAIVIDASGYVWMGTMNGLNRLDTTTGEITQYEIPGQVVRALHVDDEGKLYIGSYEGVLFYNEVTNTVEKIDLDLPSPYVMVIKEPAPGVLTLGLWDGGVADVDLVTGRVDTSSYVDNRVYAIHETEDGTRWVGTWGGGLFIDQPDGTRDHEPGDGKDGSLPHPVVYSLLEDHSGIVWIGTNGGGLCKVNPRKSNYVRLSHDPEEDNSLSAGKINAILRDDEGYLWTAVYNVGVDKYDPETETITKYRFDSQVEGSLPSDNVATLYLGDDGTLYFGTGAGVVVYEKELDRFTTLDILPEESIVYALEQQDHYLWIGTYTQGVYRYNVETGELRQYKHGSDGRSTLSDNLVYDIEADSNGNLWVGTNNGLNVMRKGEDAFAFYHRKAGDYSQLASNTIRTILEDSRGNIWFGLVGGGISQYDDETDTFNSYTEEDGMASNVVTGLLEGPNKQIWAATHNGLSILDPETGEIINLTPDDGIGGWEFNSGYYQDDNGTLLFGGIHGITMIPGLTSDDYLEPPQMYIKGIELFQEPLMTHRMVFNNESLELGAKENFLSFNFVALDYDAPEKTRYSYYLEGFDSGWIYAGTRDYATYSNLPSGDYRFMVKAETAKGIQSEAAEVSFTIATPWYQSNVAYLLYMAVVVLAIVMLLKVREGQLISRQNAVLEAVNLKLEDANQQLEALSTSDPLTGLYNRRYFNTVFEEHFLLAKRSQRPISVVMFDIDRFKDINDHYGHMAGDEVLIHVGAAAAATLPRSTDFIARFGGDEYVVVLYDTDLTGASKVAKNIKEAAEAIVLKHENREYRQLINISMGVVSRVPAREDAASELISQADKALYKAKKEGRNRIRYHQDNM